MDLVDKQGPHQRAASVIHGQHHRRAQYRAGCHDKGNLRNEQPYDRQPAAADPEYRLKLPLAQADG